MTQKHPSVAAVCAMSYFNNSQLLLKSFQAHVNVDNIAALEDVDQCVLYYNHAVILYHTRQYQKTVTILEKLFQYVEPAALQRKAMFLLIETLLCTQQVSTSKMMFRFWGGKTPNSRLERKSQKKASAVFVPSMPETVMFAAGESFEHHSLPRKSHVWQWQVATVA